jgi:hypothetical protein
MMDIISVIARGMLVNCPNKGGAVTSPMIEKILEYRFLADLTSELYQQGIPCDVMRGDVDHHGYDLAIEANGILRHIQLKGQTHGARTGNWNFNVNLWERGSGCIVILEHKDFCREISRFKYLGGPPGQPLSKDLIPRTEESPTEESPKARPSGGKKLSKKVRLTSRCFGEKQDWEVKKLVLKLFGEPQHRSSSAEVTLQAAMPQSTTFQTCGL